MKYFLHFETVGGEWDLVGLDRKTTSSTFPVSKSQGLIALFWFSKKLLLSCRQFRESCDMQILFSRFTHFPDVVVIDFLRLSNRYFREAI
ncbi:MAG: hypothetical protein DMG70_03505 [Acidobacteria bacterium]|nr:MAG: hypothetical protein DMG70_03505 [Acidobacteriota bacterium]PYY04783.1 MAG: hypothetical protein DMG69_29085 [Acidobacteriota bacterium]